MVYILSGDKTELERVVREQRVRVERGLIKLTPLDTTLASLTGAVNAISDGAAYPTDEKKAGGCDCKECDCDHDGKEVNADDCKEVLPTDEKTPANVGAKESARTAKK